MDRRLFEPEDRIAPGLYMDYWQQIAKKYGNEQLHINKLKPYREVRNGAILAAMWTKTTDRKHFVSFPQPTTFNGKPSYHLAN
jgi:hypothetical protein